MSQIVKISPYFTRDTQTQIKSVSGAGSGIAKSYGLMDRPALFAYQGSYTDFSKVVVSSTINNSIVPGTTLTSDNGTVYTVAILCGVSDVNQYYQLTTALPDGFGVNIVSINGTSIGSPFTIGSLELSNLGSGIPEFYMYITQEPLANGEKVIRLYYANNYTPVQGDTIRYRSLSNLQWSNLTVQRLYKVQNTTDNSFPLMYVVVTGNVEVGDGYVYYIPGGSISQGTYILPIPPETETPGEVNLIGINIVGNTSVGTDQTATIISRNDSPYDWSDSFTTLTDYYDVITTDAQITTQVEIDGEFVVTFPGTKFVSVSADLPGPPLSVTKYENGINAQLYLKFLKER